jgi:hypothetical protein
MSTGIRRQDTTPPYPDPAQLAGLGNAASGHATRRVGPGGGLALPGGYLKWYDIHHPDTAIPFNTRDQARDFLRGEAAAGRLELGGELGFALLHQAADETYVLLACTWHDDELWQAAYRREGDGVFTARSGGAVQGVAELGATCHERLAWSRYLGSARDEAAKRAYLADVFEGEA